ncbi:MAG: hypothetical protein HUJ23_07745, partial [Methylophaga sp.]|nr:hypothetical protein [Methylophaga sp.]
RKEEEEREEKERERKGGKKGRKKKEEEEEEGERGRGEEKEGRRKVEATNNRNMIIAGRLSGCFCTSPVTASAAARDESPNRVMNISICRTLIALSH